MVRLVKAQFDDPKTVATYLGEAIGTHYSAALRAAEAYGRHLAAARESLLQESYDGQVLRDFWVDLMKSEEVRVKSPKVMKSLGSTPSLFFQDFLDTADEVFGEKYKDAPPQKRKKVGHSEHARCLRLLRDHKSEGLPDHFAVRNRVATWMQMIRVAQGYRE